MNTARAFARLVRHPAIANAPTAFAHPLLFHSSSARQSLVRSAYCPFWKRPVRYINVTRAVSSPSLPPPQPDAGEHEEEQSIKPAPPPRSVKDLPPLDERDLEETFTKGRGPGGQKINKSSSTVILRHKPTGVTVRCQEHRSQHRNREEARKLLRMKLDEIERGKQSLAAQELSRARARKARRRRKSIKKHFKSRGDRSKMDDFP